MSLISNYTFNKLDRIGNDTTDNTQRNLQNSKFANYSLATFFNETISQENIKFVSQQPTMQLSGTTHGKGLNGHIVDFDSKLLLQNTQERPLDKLSLNQRIFATVPYLGRGACDTVVESQLQQGEHISEKKSVSTIMDKNFTEHKMHYVDNTIHENLQNKHTFEESTLDGWIRGGQTTRYLSDDPNFKNNHRPNSNW